MFFVSAPLDRSTAYRLYEAHKQSGRRKHCILVLTTSGGDADAAYLMARYLRRFYEKVTICVFGYCKSAGTLLALGAHEVADRSLRRQRQPPAGHSTGTQRCREGARG